MHVYVEYLNAFSCTKEVYPVSDKFLKSSFFISIAMDSKMLVITKVSFVLMQKN